MKDDRGHPCKGAKCRQHRKVNTCGSRPVGLEIKTSTVNLDIETEKKTSGPGVEKNKLHSIPKTLVLRPQDCENEWKYSALVGIELSNGLALLQCSKKRSIGSKHHCYDPSIAILFTATSTHHRCACRHWHAYVVTQTILTGYISFI